MNTTVAPATTPALRKGRTRTCEQCSSTYRAPRSTSRFCTPACRKRAHRGTTTTAHCRTLDLLHRWLLRRSYAGQVGPVNRKDPRRLVYALSVPLGMALEEWNSWNPGASMTEPAFAASLQQLQLGRS